MTHHSARSHETAAIEHRDLLYSLLYKRSNRITYNLRLTPRDLYIFRVEIIGNPTSLVS